MNPAATHGQTTSCWRAPAGACDAHFHVFGEAGRYPYSSDLRYAPPHAPLADYLKLARGLGIERMVFVQPSAYGRDNRCMLDAMRTVGLQACRGVVDVDENIAESELAALDAIGVRAVRINVSPIKPFTAGYERHLLQRIQTLAGRCHELGWHLDFLTPAWLTQALLPTLGALKCGFSIAHLGMFLAKDGPQQAGFEQLIRLVQRSDGRGYVKLTGFYRIGVAPQFTGVAAMVQTLGEAIADQLIWGTDYPHLSFHDSVSSVGLFNFLGDAVSSTALREKILVDNPARLFGFSET